MCVVGCCQSSCWKAMKAVGNVGKSEIFRGQILEVSVVYKETFRFQVIKKLQIML